MKRFFSKNSAKNLLFAVLFVFSALLVSCQFTSPYLAAQGPVAQVAEGNDITVKCTYLDPVAIEARHGYRYNPFFAPELSFTPQKMLVFELEITNTDSAPVKLDIRDINLYYNDKAYRPMSTVQMEKKIDDYAESQSRIREKRVARTYMYENIETIEGNSVKAKYLVFMANFKDKGDVELDLPLKTPDNFDAGEFTFKYSFKLTR